jgi:hypothetical protein
VNDRQREVAGGVPHEFLVETGQCFYGHGDGNGHNGLLRVVEKERAEQLESDFAMRRVLDVSRCWFPIWSLKCLFED